MSTIKLRDVWWFAGLFEGEGHISITKPSPANVKLGANPNKHRVDLIIKMTDLDVLEKVKAKFGGNINGPYHDGNPKHRQQWRWQFGKRHQVKRLLTMISLILGDRRRQQVSEALEVLRV